MLSVGDRVVYFGSDMDWDGSEGFVTEINCPGFRPKVTAVSWETGGLLKYQDSQHPDRPFVRVFSRHLRVTYVGYNPAQTGDTDEDI